MDVIDRPVGDLIPYASNSRIHSEEQVAQIAASIKEFGFTNPILTDGDKGVIAGHGRLLAARKLGMETVPTIELSHLTENQRKAHIIADNKLALNAGWDMEMLSLEMGDLQDDGFDLSLIGFDEDELANIFVDKTEGLTNPDETPELPDDPVTKPGDVWLLGKHRLMCGDSTEATAVSALLAGVEPHLMVTDPPYGVEYDANWRNEADRANGKKIGATALAPVRNDDNADWSEAWALFPGDVAYVWHAGNKAHIVAESLEANDLAIRAQIIWAKNNMVIGRGDYHPKHEPCWYAIRKNKKGHYAGGRKQTTVWDIDKPMKSETGHSTQKPVECMKRPIENNSSPGQAIYEPFSGSGTTIIAGEMTGRAIYAMELSPAYVDMAVTRWQNFTGERAALEETGANFPLIKEAA
tara:strand:+ start:1992 stop:3221 length:1230 start_codon:yes stop_codon:yes gene_type:complete